MTSTQEAIRTQAPSRAPRRSAPGGFGRATAVMAAGTSLSRLSGLLRTVAFGGLGLSALTDAYTLANNSPNIVYELVLGGVLSATLVPVFVDLFNRERAGGPDGLEARDGVSAIVTVAGVIALGLAATLALIAPVIIHFYTLRDPDPAKRALATNLLRMFAPQVAVYTFITLGTALLNAKRRFAAPMLAPLLNNLTVIVVFVWAQRLIARLLGDGPSGADPVDVVRSSTSATLLLGVGTTAGVAAMGLALLPSLARADLRLRWNWNPRHPAVRVVLRLSGWTMAYVLANQAALQFVTWVASSHRGDVTAYNLAYSTYFLLPHGVLAVSIMTALQPQLSQDFIDRRRGRFRRHLLGGISATCALLIPAAVGYMVLSRPVVELTLRYRSMTVEGTNLIADTLRMFVVGLPAFSCYLLLMNALKAMRDTRATFEINVIENAINIVLAGLFYNRWGVQGLGLAFACAYLISAVLAARAVARRTRGIGHHELLMRLARIASASLVMGILTAFTSSMMRRLLVDHGTTASRVALAVQVGTSVAVGVTVYVLVATRMGVTELATLRARATRRTRSSRPSADRQRDLERADP